MLTQGDKYEQGFEVAGFVDIFILFGFVIFDTYLIMDDQLKIETVVSLLLFFYQLVLAIYPTVFFVRAYISSKDLAVTSQRDKQKIHDYRVAYSIRTYAGVLYQTGMYLMIKYFPSVICQDKYWFMKRHEDDGDICQLLLAFGGEALFIMMLITAVSGTIALAFIKKYEGELTIKSIQNRLTRA